MIRKELTSNVHSDLASLFDTSFGNALRGRSEQFLYNIDTYLNNCKSAKGYYLGVGAGVINRVAETNGKKMTQEGLVALGETYVSLMGIFDSMAFVGIDMSKDGFPSALYTRSKNILHTLHNSGMLETDEFDKVIDAVVGKRTFAGFEEGKFLMVRLDVSKVLRNKIIFTPVIPKQRLSIGVNKDFVFIPVTFMYRGSDLITDFVWDKPFRFVKTSSNTKVSGIATLSEGTVREVYKSVNPRGVDNKIRKISAGFDTVRLRFVAHDLESSVEVSGNASFRIEMLDSINIVSLADVDVSQHEIKYEVLRKIFKSKVRRFTTGNFDNFGLFNTSGFANLTDKAGALIGWSEKIQGHNLYNIMRQYSNIFGDVDKSLANWERMSPKVMKQLVAVGIPENHEDTKDMLREMLNSGLVKLTMFSSSSNVVSERLCTNNKALLSKFLGDDYVAVFESVRTKLNYVKDIALSGKIKSRTELENLLSKYSLMSYIDVDKVYGSIDRGFRDGLFEEIDRVIQELNAKQKSSSDDLVTFRCVFADGVSDFYRSVNVNNILAVEYAKYTDN